MAGPSDGERDVGAPIQIPPDITVPMRADAPPGDSLLPAEHICQFFAYGHLRPELQAISKPFFDLAAFVLTLPHNPERTVALRKLLEAKDAAVRAALAK